MAKKIESLSETEWVRIIKMRNEYCEIARGTNPVDRPKMAKIYRDLMKNALNAIMENTYWFEGPTAALYEMKKFRIKKSDMNNALYFSWAAYWGAYLTILESIPGMKTDKKLSKLLATFTATLEGGIYWVFEHGVVACERPCTLTVDEHGRLHNLNGPAIAWRDGTEYYFVTGIKMEGKYIKEPLSLPLSKIKKERNNDIRRAYIQVYGMTRYLKDINARKLDETEAEKLFELPDGSKIMLCWDGSTNKIHEVIPSPNATTVREAQQSISGLPMDMMLERS